jgi:Periplasmic binding protein
VATAALCLLAASVTTGTGAWGATDRTSSTTLTGASHPIPPDQASTSARGVTGTTINVVFPVVSLGSLAGKLGFAETAEFGEQKKAIHLFVDHINQAGGINGRKINPIIATFTPESTAEMRALCKDWTEGSPAAFAVLDGVGDWSNTNQLCVAQEGKTPFLGQWTTVSNWTTDGSPYLWWTGPSQTQILQAVVNWGLSTGLLGGKHKVGVIVGDQASDQLALHQYLLPDLKRAGVNPVVEEVADEPTESATTGTEAPLAVQKLKSDGVGTVFPILSFNAFTPILQAETAQSYFPRLMLSDYEDSIESSLGLMAPVGPDGRALTGQEGLTTFTLGGLDGPQPQSEGGYDPGVRACWNLWHAAYPQTPPGNINDYIVEQGPVQGWCQEINLFATAAKAAGRHLNRRTFVEAMSRIKNYTGGYSLKLSYGPDKFSGPTEFQVVKLHENTPPSSLCRDQPNQPLVHTCWVVEKPYQPLPPVG